MPSPASGVLNNAVSSALINRYKDWVAQDTKFINEISGAQDIIEFDD